MPETAGPRQVQAKSRTVGQFAAPQLAKYVQKNAFSAWERSPMHPRLLTGAALTLLLSGPFACCVRAADEPATPAEDGPTTVLEAATDAIKQVAGEETATVVEDVVTEAVVESIKAASADVVQDKTLVLRISREFIRDHVPKVIDQATPVDRCLFGAHVTGKALTNGKPLVVEGRDPTDPGFGIHFSGTTSTRTVASKGPVRTYTRGLATYEVQRQIHFDSAGFRAGATSIECDYESSLSGLGTPPGLRGRIVRRFAMPEIQKTKPAADAIALRDLRAEVLEAFEQKTDQLVKDLNKRMPWQDTLSIVAPSGAERVRTLTTTPIYVEIRSTVVDSEIPDLPGESEDLRAPIELWVLGEPSATVSAELIALWGLSKLALPQLKEAAAEVIDDVKQHKPVASGIEPELLGDWWVLRLGADLLEQLIGEAVESADAEDSTKQPTPAEEPNAPQP